MKRGQIGLSLIEVTAAMAVSAMVLTGVTYAVTELNSGPGQAVTEIALADQVRSATSVIRDDAARAQSYEAGGGGLYGTFRWLDLETFPPERNRVDYTWEDGVLFRERTVEGEAQGSLALVRHVLAQDDVTFALAAAPNPSAATSAERALTVSIEATIEGAVEEHRVVETGFVEVSLRPEQTEPLEHHYFFLRDRPYPATVATHAEPDLPLTVEAPTEETLFNYDLDRDSQPGLLLLRSAPSGPGGAGSGGEDEDEGEGERDDDEDEDEGERDDDEDEDDRREDRDRDSPPDTEQANALRQDWLTSPLDEPLAIDGRVTLFVSGAAAHFETGRAILFEASFYDVSPDGEALLIGNKPVSWFDSTSGWTTVILRGDPTEHTIAAGHRLRVSVRVGADSATNGMLAYGTREHRALVIVPATP